MILFSAAIAAASAAAARRAQAKGRPAAKAHRPALTRLLAAEVAAAVRAAAGRLLSVAKTWRR